MSNTQSPSMIVVCVAVYPYKHRIKLTFVIMSAKMNWIELLVTILLSDSPMENCIIVWFVIDFRSTCYILLKCVNVPLCKTQFFFFYQQPFIYIPLKLRQTPIQLLKVLASVQLVNIDMPQNLCWSTNRHTIISALGKRKRVMNLWAHHAPIEQFLKNCHNYSQMQTLACRRNHVFFLWKRRFIDIDQIYYYKIQVCALDLPNWKHPLSRSMLSCIA